MKNKKKKICMIVQDKMVKGGIAAVISGYYGSVLEKDYDMIYVESYKDGGKIAKLIKGIASYLQFMKVLFIDRPDIVHIHSSFGPSFYRKLPFIYMASWSKKIIVNHIHGADFEEFYTNAGDYKKTLIRKVYAKCTALIALSSEWKERLSQIVPADRITVIENYSVLHEDAVIDRINRKSNSKVLFLGEIGKRKGCYDIPAVAEAVVKAVPSAKFILGGAGNIKDEKAVKDLFEQHGVIDHIVFPGWVRGEEKDKLLRDADVFFLPSYNEGMPMSILDAMGYGLPIVSTNVGGIPKIVRNGENGACCSAGDIKNLSQALIKLLTDDEYRKQASEESRNIIAKGYSLTTHLKQLEKLYEKIGG